MFDDFMLESEGNDYIALLDCVYKESLMIQNEYGSELFMEADDSVKKKWYQKLWDRLVAAWQWIVNCFNSLRGKKFKNNKNKMTKKQLNLLVNAYIDYNDDYPLLHLNPETGDYVLYVNRDIGVAMKYMCNAVVLTKNIINHVIEYGMIADSDLKRVDGHLLTFEDGMKRGTSSSANTEMAKLDLWSNEVEEAVEASEIIVKNFEKLKATADTKDGDKGFLDSVQKLLQLSKRVINALNTVKKYIADLDDRTSAQYEQLKKRAWGKSSGKDKVEKIVSESADMITALESIGPMYGIPSTHMLVEDTGSKSLRVIGDHIITPPDVKPNTKAIVCAIGGVLDHISQRINNQVGDFQKCSIQKGRIEDHIKRDANPSKGTVIARHVDSNGDEILVYDSGLVDMPSTKEAIVKVNELRQNMQIPMYNPTAMMANKSTYFTDEDDISVEEPRPEKVSDKDEVDFSKMTNESALIIDMIAHFNDTTHLGYDWLQEQGFDFVKPIDTMVQEDGESSGSDSNIKPSDVKHMRFDNSHIIKAIDYFNKARDEQKDKKNGEWDVKEFIESKNYKRAIAELDKQFDCKINIRFFNDKSGKDRNDLVTPIMDNIKQNMHISKSKGFQLHGAPVDIFVVNKALDEEMNKSTNTKLFGQFVCASLCHEIFHNIVSVIRHNNSTFNYTLMSALTLASSAPNAKSRRITFEKYVKTLEAQGIKMSKFQKKKLIKDLCYISAGNEKSLINLRRKMETVETTAEADREMMQYIKAMEIIDEAYTKMEKQSQKAKKNKKLYKTMHVIGTILTCTGVGAIVGVPMLLSGTDDPLQGHDKYMRSVNKEEYYCDLFAGIYQLPLTFMMGFKHRTFTINQIPEARLNRIANLEKRVSQFGQSSYPSLSERNYAAMTIAKDILKSGDVAPQIKEYCEWIVSNYSNILTTDIGSNYNGVTFDPSEAANLDKHIQNLIDNNEITVTESYKMWSDTYGT